MEIKGADQFIVDGQVGKTRSTLLTVPVRAKYFLSFWSLFNTSSTVQTVKVFIKPKLVSRQIEEYTLASKGSARVLTEGEILPLEAGDIVQAETTSDGAVDFVISGYTWS